MTMMKNTKITKRDRFNSLIALLTALKADEVVVIDNFDYDDAIEFATAEIALLDKKAIKAKEQAKAKKAGDDALTVAIQDVLTDDFATVNEIVEKVAMDELTNAKAVYRLNALVKAGVAVKEDVTVNGGEGVKARKVVAFKLA